MELENYTISGKHVLHYGELIIHESDVNDDFFIPGKYEFYLKEVHDLQRLVEINGTVYTNLRIPHQEEIVNVLAKTVEQIRDENWFTDSNLSQQQFATLEKIVARALMNFNLDDKSKMGLIGELHVLDSIIANAPAYIDKNTIVESWQGHKTKSRDFIFESHCIEVKTTIKNESIHHINNLNQVDPTDDDGGITNLFLASIGLEYGGDGFSIPSLIDSILSKIDGDELKRDFLNNVQQYGVHMIGYNHNVMKNWTQFQDVFSINFERHYNMRDPNIKTLRFNNLIGMNAVIEKTIKYTIKLDSVIQGSINNPMDISGLVTDLFSNDGID
jgi:hypothetical protein